MTTAAVVGSTGLCGSNILQGLLSLSSVSKVSSITRRATTAEDTTAKLNAIVESDSSTWKSQIASLQPTPDVFYSGLATTRAQAGGFENQKKIDYDLNLELAKAAADAGIKTYVLISAALVSPDSFFAYPRLKGQLEEQVSALGFEHVVFVRPGLLVGERQESRWAESFLGSVANCARTIGGNRARDFWAQDGKVIGRAAVNAGLQCARGEAKERVWRINAPDIVRLGRDEWKEE